MIPQIWNWFMNLIIIHTFLPKYFHNLNISLNLVSLSHALLTIMGSLYFIMNETWESDIFNDNQLKLIYFSASYFIYDSIFILINKCELMFLAHHCLILLIYYITTSNNIGSKFIIYSIFLGEITNPLQITWSISRVLNYNKITDYIFPIFSFNFIIVRTFVIPYYHYLLLKDMFGNSYTIINYTLIIISLIGNIGSLMWVRAIILKLIK